MADNTTLPIPPGATNGDIVRDIDRAGVKTQVVQLDIGGAAAESLVTGTMPVSGNVGVTGSVAVTGTFWQATQPVSGTVTVGNASLAVTGPLTDTQLRASAVPVSLASTTITGSVAVTGPLTDTQLRATPVPVSLTSTTITGTVAATQSGTWNIGSITTLPALVAGTAIIGKVGIDQTTVGTTNAVSIAQLGANTVLTGVGAAGTGSLRVTLSSDAVSAAAALADALANPTLGQQAVLNSVFNGTTWDRQRGMGGNATTGDTGAKTATGNGATQTNVGNKGVQILIVLGTVSGTTPTCVFKVQGSVDGGTTFYDIPGAATASLTATGNFGIAIYPGIAVTAGTTTSGSTATANMPLPRTWRLVWTIGGTTPSFTITNVQYNYLPN